MFQINRESNSITPLASPSFSDTGFKEREHLQEWIVKRPSCLEEELLIIQKEFSGFSDTRERLDILALDKQGCLVLIENKLDDTGRDVTWQALKYASYCSGLSKENIRSIYQEFLKKADPTADAGRSIADFLEADNFEDLVLNKGFTQRIILIAANFRKEVTSTVLWLSNFKLRIQCFRVTAHSMGEQLFLNIEQIIPVKDAEDFMIGIADKALDEVEGVKQEKNRHKVRREFWAEIIKAMAGKSSLFQNISPGTYEWIGTSSGVRGVGYNFAAGKSYGRAELYIERSEKEENKFIFDQLHGKKASIETTFGDKLTWERLGDKQASRIKSETHGSIYDSDEWPALIEFMTDAMVRLEKAFKEPLTDINQQLKNRKSQV
jgi:hypothetical protein